MEAIATVLATALFLATACALLFRRHLARVVLAADDALTGLPAGRLCGRCGAITSQHLSIKAYSVVCKACYVVLPGAGAELVAATRYAAWCRLLNVRRRPHGVGAPEATGGAAA